MAGEEEAAEKSFEATPKKLQEARKRGEVPLSQDLLTSAVYAGVVVAGLLFGLDSLRTGGTALYRMIETPETMAPLIFSASGITVLSGPMLAIGAALSAWLLLPFAAALLAAIAQQALVFAPTKLKPKLSRISPLSIAKQKFGREGLFNFFKSFVKLIVYSVLLGVVCFSRAEEILQSPTLSLDAGLLLTVDLCLQFLLTALTAMLVIGATDFVWQRAEHLRKQRMSLKEIRDEQKDSEGDPHTKQARRQKGMDIATNRMLRDVPDASVVIVNPTHYAVALKWTREKGAAPICVAKGTDEIAARIREVASDHGVPIYRDPPTARAVFATTEIGVEISPDQYRAVAASIRFADAMRARSRGGWT